MIRRRYLRNKNKINVPTPDCYYDFSKGSNDDENREIIKDYSGNGNDAVAHNFVWSGMSGYNGINVKYDYTYSNTNRCEEIIKDGFKLTFKNITEDYNLLFATLTQMYTQIGLKIKVHITGIPNGGRVYFGTDKWINATKDGDYEGILTKDTNGNTTIASKGCIGSTITVEFIPLYPRALVFDGVDDYVSLDAFDSGFKTMFMVCNPFVLNKILYEQRQAATINNQFAIYLDEPTVAYKARNTKGITYINSVLNNKLLTRELINKKQCITVFNNSNLEKNIPLIGTNISHELNEKMALYKFLGFKEALTEEQIQAVIKKYNLLDGIDEIEVS